MLSLPNNGHFMIENTKYIQINVYKSYLGRLIYKSLDFIKTFAEYFIKFVAIFSRFLIGVAQIFTK